MKLALYAGQTAGLITLLTLRSTKNIICYVIPEDDQIKEIARLFHLPLLNKNNLNDQATITLLTKSVDVFICCHGRKILSETFVTHLKCVNLHPCLYKYKGTRPIRHLITDRNPRASVAAHWMIKQVDAEKTIVEKFKLIKDIEHKTEENVYRELYPLYAEVMLKTLTKMNREFSESD